VQALDAEAIRAIPDHYWTGNLLKCEVQADSLLKNIIRQWKIPGAGGQSLPCRRRRARWKWRRKLLERLD
jgi:hypothetical protein